MKYIGIDIGGTTVKGIVIDELANVYANDSIETGERDGGNSLLDNIVTIIDRMLKSAKIEKSECVGIGVGCPGMIDSNNGKVVFAGNLKLKDFSLAELVSEKTGLPVKLTNDANAAALGEAKFGAGKKYKDSILITLGTGVGGGIVVDGKLFEGGMSAGTEVGHTVIVYDGEQCTCGRKGCFERYCSATALIEQTRTAMLNNRNSLMWNDCTAETVSGKTAFKHYETDLTAKSVVDKYIGYLACGITNLANVFRPQVVMLGGGVSGEGEKLSVPVQDLLDKQIFAGQSYAPVKVVIASLGNKAGAFGAAALLI